MGRPELDTRHGYCLERQEQHQDELSPSFKSSEPTPTNNIGVALLAINLDFTDRINRQRGV